MARHLVPDEAIIKLRVPPALKGRWVRASRAAGLRLTDWIIEAVEAHMTQQLTRVSIPESVDFAMLKLARDRDGAVSFDWTPIEAICRASGIDTALLRDGPEDNVAGLIAHWYAAHRQRGGAPDAVAEDMYSEVLAEERIGQRVSLPPGRA